MSRLFVDLTLLLAVAMIPLWYRSTKTTDCLIWQTSAHTLNGLQTAPAGIEWVYCPNGNLSWQDPTHHIIQSNLFFGTFHKLMPGMSITSTISTLALPTSATGLASPPSGTKYSFLTTTPPINFLGSVSDAISSPSPPISFSAASLTASTGQGAFVASGVNVYSTGSTQILTFKIISWPWIPPTHHLLGFGCEFKATAAGSWTFSTAVSPASSRVVVPIWFLMLIALLPTFISIKRRLRNRRRRMQNKCIACGYDLRRSPERCPECGMAVV